jgi:hypothetical protein
MVGVLAESVKGNRFDPRSGQTKRQYNWFFVSSRCTQCSKVRVKTGW